LRKLAVPAPIIDRSQGASTVHQPMGHHRRRGTEIKLKTARQRLIVLSGAVRHVASPFFRFDHLCPVRIVVRFPFARAVPAVNAFSQSAFSLQVKLGLDPMLWRPIRLITSPVSHRIPLPALPIQCRSCHAAER
jgi:hypothetical protein